MENSRNNMELQTTYKESDVTILWIGEDGSENTDFMWSSDDLKYRLERLESYGAQEIKVFYQGQEIDNSVLRDFSYQIPGVRTAK